ncbi:retrotransposon gag family protein, partial [Shewanella sp.]|uniref:retrotransposon gag family protein n=1 Tax=Shewanella sp. TaxID=50422 RepID=UPI003D14BDB4
WWETYCNTHANVDTITWNEFKARFRTHYVPRGTMKLKRKEFADLKQGGMIVNEYLNSFIQLSRYAPDDVSTDEKKQDVFLNGLNDDIQFQLLNTDYADFQHMVDKPIVVENKIREMEEDGVTPCSEKEGTKPPYVCPGCSNHTHDNNMINR